VAVLYAVTRAFKHDGVAVVEEAVEQSDVDGVVAVEDGAPFFEGQDNGASLIAGADDPEEATPALGLFLRRYLRNPQK
jgi:hypothetical protein